MQGVTHIHYNAMEAVWQEQLKDMATSTNKE
jgi:hypothetical protein